MALLQGVGPSWLLQTLASLYWRVRGNTHNAMDCLRVALTSVPGEFCDVVLVSLGSLLHTLGYLDEALKAASDALVKNSVEVRRQHNKVHLKMGLESNMYNRFGSDAKHNSCDMVTL